MIFQHTWTLILEGRKTQTRRLVKPNQEFDRWNRRVFSSTLRGLPLPNHMTLRQKTIYQVGNTYALQTERGGKAIARICIFDIRKTLLQDIQEWEAVAEGCLPMYDTTTPPYEVAKSARESFIDLWGAVHKRAGNRWQDNPAVWVLEFELVK